MFFSPQRVFYPGAGPAHCAKVNIPPSTAEQSRWWYQLLQKGLLTTALTLEVDFPIPFSLAQGSPVTRISCLLSGQS